MAQTLFSDKVAAKFNVREYNESLPREQRRILADSENIKVNVVYPLSELPAQYKKTDGTPDEFVNVYQSKHAKETNQPADLACVTFKIGTNCVWFDKYGVETKRPTNEYLDSHKFEVQVCYSRKDRNVSKKTAPCGYWANGIMFLEMNESMFAGQAFEHADEPEDREEQAHATEPKFVQHFDNDEKKNELPF